MGSIWPCFGRVIFSNLGPIRALTRGASKVCIPAWGKNSGPQRNSQKLGKRHALKHTSTAAMGWENARHGGRAAGGRGAHVPTPWPLWRCVVARLVCGVVASLLGMVCAGAGLVWLVFGNVLERWFGLNRNSFGDRLKPNYTPETFTPRRMGVASPPLIGVPKRRPGRWLIDVPGASTGSPQPQL